MARIHLFDPPMSARLGRIEAHGAADLFPLMSVSEITELAEDIKANGLQAPIVLLRPKDGGKNLILDGRNRIAALERIGLPVFGDDGNLVVKHEIIDETDDFRMYPPDPPGNIAGDQPAKFFWQPHGI